MIALIDADSILYKVGFAIEDKVIWNEMEYLCGDELVQDVSYYSDLEVAKKTVVDMINGILEYTECDEPMVVLSGKGNFRLSLPTEYKYNRKDVRKPEYFEELREFTISYFKATVTNGIEADDLVVYLKTSNPEDYILCAIDKDVLYQTVGTHYNYGKGEEVTTTPFQAMKFAYIQTLAGDSSDGYKGCPTIGIKKAEKLLADCKTEKCMWAKVVEAYKANGLTMNDALNTMRLANMHQYNGSEVILWSPPV